ncbi:type II toxin-antitoxin system VapB family antitoxin [Nevskia sp.]|uniref:type II toxin-antitoxin system VapB family antitoxin n=1 Tax=Nevskia sp. TaxID=1929292 RepID=UPI0025FDAF4D|nr:type II toxin-antitoxin system VapB family antitoxin [Nevskia sp.]
MRTTLNLDDQLVGTAMNVSGHTEKTAVIHAALREFIQMEASRALARAGGTDPAASAGPRRPCWLGAGDAEA